MKKFSQLVKESKQQLSIQDDSVNYLSVGEIEKYLELGNKFLSDETKKICKWLIDNNDTYIKKLSTGDSDNALVDFYNAGVPKDSDLKDLYKNIGLVIKSGRILEIPTFQTRNQFDQIINKKASVDEVVLDLESEAGRNEVAKRYTPLVHKIVNSWVGKTAFDKDDLFSYGMRGLTWAMNLYGKKRDRLKEKEKETGEEIDVSKYRSYTFLQFAAQMIRYSILDAARNESHLVRIPISRQKKEKDENGYIAKSNSVSGDKRMGSKDGGDGKSLFDLVGGMENPGKSIDKKEIEDLWAEIMSELGKKFNEQTMDIFMNHFGFGLAQGEKKKSGKEMAAKYGYSSPSSITAEVTKVLNFIRKDKDMYQRFCDIFELMQEAKHDEDEYETDDEPIYVNNNLKKQFDALNDIDGND
ncbi:MAG: hypothetical protein IJH39_08305 [Clostridia bacterium]|nr:hypothetical protein [Clostridia bacterium]